ncbi:MAG: DUF998 domain-containing protein, partial [Bacteroidetes bacterium]|nr:DUF998 domain-containing protein [Bacteroidota bacterium]
MRPATNGPDSLLISYLTLRQAVGWLAILLVPAMVFGDMLLGHTHYIRVSVSAYYHSSVRDEYVGIICCIALFLFSYNGYSKQDSIFSKLAGFFALCIALLPTSATDDKTDLISKAHYITSGIFFAILAYMSVFLFTKTSGTNMTLQKRQRNRVYRVCGIVMAVAVIGIPIDGIPAVHALVGAYKPTLILEIIALTSFG